MGDHLTLRLDDGSVLILWADDTGRLGYTIERPEAPGDRGVVPDELGLARLAVWSRDMLRRP